MASTDGSSLWSHDLSRDLQKVDTKWTRFPTGLDGLAFAFRLPTSFYWIRYIICLVYILTHRWGSVLNTGRVIGNETSEVDNVFLPDDPRFGSDAKTNCVVTYNLYHVSN